MEPLLPDERGRSREGLDDLALTLEREGAALASALPEGTRASVIELLRIANAYYSNRIEGHDTRPGAIERALRNDLSEDATLRALQREARAHVEVERLADGYFASRPDESPLTANSLCWLHREFYERVPPELCYVEDPVTKRRELVVPGELRTFDVTVGRHDPPPPAVIREFLDYANERYAADRLRGLERAIAFAASHHRLLWIHPFADGNGRVARLATMAYGRAVGIGALGLWTPSRGLARRREAYMAALEEADNGRLYDTDGRGPLSAALLARFVRFFLEVCVDQARYMRSVLGLEALGDRLDAYARLRDDGIAPGPEGRPLRAEGGTMLRIVAARGELPRGEAVRLSGLRERTGRAVLGELLADGLLTTESPKGAVRIAFPTHAVPYLFPGMYPEGIAGDPVTVPP